MNKVKYYREQKGMSQEELADRVGVSLEGIKIIESGIEVSISTQDAAKISEALGQEPLEIFVDYDLRRKGESCAMLEAAIALHRAKESIIAIVSENNWDDAEGNDPKIIDAENRLCDAMDAAGITNEEHEKIFEAAIIMASAYRDLALVLGLEIGFGLVQQKTAPEPYDPFGFNE